MIRLLYVDREQEFDVDATIRLATEADAPAIAGLLHDLIIHHSEAPPERATLERAVHVVIRLPRAWYIVAQSQEQVLGTLQVQERFSTWGGTHYGYVEDVCVRETARNAGVGARLLEFLLDWARLQGWSRLDLDVLTANTSARRFYGRHGFGDTGYLVYRRELTHNG